MRGLKRFLSLSPAERSLLLRSFCWLAVIRIGLWLFPFQTVRKIAIGARTALNSPYSVSRVAWAVQAVSRYVPGARCLPQALACQALLARSGHTSRLEIGVAKDEKNEFAAHAWVVCGGRIVIGESEVERYTPLAVWED